MKTTRLIPAVLALSCIAVFASDTPRTSKPNILFIVADDLGCGDVGCYGATQIRTPNIDRLATQGMRATAAHSSASVCTPSRYGILTGREYFRYEYNWEGELLVEPDRPTVAKTLRDAGYATAYFGKWHLGWGTRDPGKPRSHRSDWDWNAEILSPGVLETGYDTFFGTPFTPNEPPMVFVQDRAIVGRDPNDPLIVLGPKEVTGFGYGVSRGAKAAHEARPVDRIDPIVTEKVVAYLESHKGKPFYLHFALAAPHVPIEPSPEFKGRTKLGRYGDFVEQMDHCVGRVLDTLERIGQAGNTLVIFTSDNGAIYHPDVYAKGHKTNGDVLGQKTDAWEGGVRVPFIARWPGRIPAGSVTQRLISLNDFYATACAAANAPIPAGGAPDSLNQLSVLGNPEAPAVRTEMTYIGITPPGLALRTNDWLFLPVQGSLGVSTDLKLSWAMQLNALGQWHSDYDEQCNLKPNAPKQQLYNLASDPGQHTNIAAAHPGMVRDMALRLAAISGKPIPVPPVVRGLTAGPDGEVLKDGKPFRGIGVNYFDCFLRTLANGNDATYDDGFAVLKANGIPFARFSATGYWPRDMILYQTGREEYFRRLDGVVRSAEKHGIGLVPSLFWYHACVPDLVGESCDQWGNPQSKTHEWMRQYVKEVVSRYKDSPAIWMWEFGNEYSLSADIPGNDTALPPVVSHMLTARQRTERDKLTHAQVRVAFAEFAKAVRALDPYRLISTGDAFPRTSAWHLERHDQWTEDNEAQFAEMLGLNCPDPIGVISLHAYKEEDLQRLEWAARVSGQIKKPLFVGEFGSETADKGADAMFRRLLKGILDNKVPLAAVWVFDMAAQPESNLRHDNAGAWQLEEIARANELLRGNSVTP